MRGIIEQYALTEASYTVTRILQKYDRIEATESSLPHEIPVISTLTMAPREARVKLHLAATE